MPIPSDTAIKESFKNLDRELKSVMVSVELEAAIGALETEFNISPEENVALLSRLIGFFMADFLSPSEFLAELKGVGIKAEKLEQFKKDLVEKVFRPFHYVMQKNGIDYETILYAQPLTLPVITPSVNVPVAPAIPVTPAPRPEPARLEARPFGAAAPQTPPTPAQSTPRPQMPQMPPPTRPPMSLPVKPSVMSPPPSAKPFIPPPKITFPQAQTTPAQTPRPVTPVPPLKEVRFTPAPRPATLGVQIPAQAKPLPQKPLGPPKEPGYKPAPPNLPTAESHFGSRPANGPLKPPQQPVSIKPIIEQKPLTQTPLPPTTPVVPPPTIVKPLAKPRNNHEVIDLSKFDFPREKTA